MKVLIEYPMEPKRKRVEEINTLEELLNLCKKEGFDLIIAKEIDKRYPETDFSILVYDGYIE